VLHYLELIIYVSQELWVKTRMTFFVEASKEDKAEIRQQSKYETGTLATVFYSN
jgi:hypothetical protein